MRTTREICLFGASPDTGNQGVSALCFSTLGALQDEGFTDVTVFDHGSGVRATEIGRGRTPLRYQLAGARPGRRVWHRDHLLRMDLGLRSGLLGNDAARILRGAEAVLDLSAGDSFADLYGQARFRAVTAPKRLALRAGLPLVLLPQTYGPFREQRNADLARSLITGARQAWARDVDSHERMRTLLGADFDAQQHRLGVDMAFGLWDDPFRLPAELLPWFCGSAGRERPPVVGINVSGLLANDPQAPARFDLRTDYAAALERIVEALLAETDANVLLIPHVHAPEGHPESDLTACRALLAHAEASVTSRRRARIAVMEEPLDARRLKWLISRLDWFCGARMHATIASLSRGVATAGLAYSLKARGVFASCAAEASLFDLRGMATSNLVDDVLEHYRQREAHSAALGAALPTVQARLADQRRRIATAIRTAPASTARAA